jgi:hypothetical protein
MLSGLIFKKKVPKVPLVQNCENVALTHDEKFFTINGYFCA